ncbi:MAG: SgcJ/EcaC family oxidoreductase [Vicinamibacteraceae bacterium]
MYRPAAVAAMLALTLVTAAPIAAQAPVSDDAAVRALVAAYSAARDKSDAAALTALFTADADQLVSSGEWRRGREAVVQGSLASSQQAQGTRTFTIETVRMLAANVAVADSRYDIAQTGGTTRRMWASWLLVKDGTAWKIAAIRNMLPAAPAGAAAPPR